MTDYLNESAEDVQDRALKSLESALARAGLSVADEIVVRHVMRKAWPDFCGALQDARRDRAEVYQLRAAALLMLVNVFWETVCVLTPPEKWTTQAERFLRQLTSAIRQGPGR